jgi:hypothetical protein
MKAGLPADAYAERLRAAMESVCRPDYPAGMIPWLDDACPILYTDLIERLPNEMQQLWERKAPLEEFDLIIAVWIELHRNCGELYRRSLVREESGGEA